MTLSRPVMQNNPILTIRWVDTKMQGYIGPDIRLTLRVSPENGVRGTEKTRNKCLYQRS